MIESKVLVLTTEHLNSRRLDCGTESKFPQIISENQSVGLPESAGDLLELIREGTEKHRGLSNHHLSVLSVSSVVFKTMRKAFDSRQGAKPQRSESF